MLHRVATANSMPTESVNQLLSAGADLAKLTPDTPGLWTLVSGAGPRLVRNACAVTVCWWVALPTSSPLQILPGPSSSYWVIPPLLSGLIHRDIDGAFLSGLLCALHNVQST